MQPWTPLTSLVVTDFLSCGWPVVGTKIFSGWVQICISEKFVPGETNFRGVKIKRDRTKHKYRNHERRLMTIKEKYEAGDLVNAYSHGCQFSCTVLIL